MKLFLTILLLAALFSTASSAGNPLCLICQSGLDIPTNWLGAQTLLRVGCSKLGPISEPCSKLVTVADLNDSYPAMYPHLVTIKRVACDKYCV
ncbi:unnamed protein product [Caenorhabditis brenneri]